MRKLKLTMIVIIICLCTSLLKYHDFMPCSKYIDTKSICSEINTELCCICGNNQRSLMANYRKSNSLGVVCLNTMNISCIDISYYTNDRKQSGTLLTNHGAHECTFKITGNPSMGLYKTEIDYSNAPYINFDVVKKLLCQACLDKVISMYNDELYLQDGSLFHGVFLIDFSTNELYPLGQSTTQYYVREYNIQIEHKAQQDNIVIYFEASKNS